MSATLKELEAFTYSVSHDLRALLRGIDGWSLALQEDNGAGFNMQNAKNLFGAFQRMHRQSEFPGSGIGLAIVQRNINLHHGKIWAESTVGKGSKFNFMINNMGDGK